MDLAIIMAFLISSGLGAFVGLEREQRVSRKQAKVAGVRTYTLIAILGTMTAYLGDVGGMYLAVAVGLGVEGLVAVGYYFSSTYTKDIGLTSEVSQLLLYCVGIMCYFTESQKIAIMVGILTALLLALKENIHDFAKEVEKYELVDTLKFAVIAFVILPILPDQAIDPWQVVNPYQVWLLVVLISGISYVGYILIKIYGVRSGLGITGILGGLTSSTAVTTSMADKVKQNHSLTKAASFAIIIAWCVMYPRILLEVAVVNQGILGELVAPITAMLVVGLVSSAMLWKNNQKIEGELELNTPFALKPALKFGGFFLIVLLMQDLSQTYLGNEGLYTVSLVSGLADVDAITLSSAKMADSGDITSDVAVNAIIIATISNTLMKLVYTYIMGTKRLFKTAAFVAFAMTTAGIGTLILL